MPYMSPVAGSTAPPNHLCEPTKTDDDEDASPLSRAARRNNASRFLLRLRNLRGLFLMSSSLTSKVLSTTTSSDDVMIMRIRRRGVTAER